jgi:hypothetical protein
MIKYLLGIIASLSIFLFAFEAMRRGIIKEKFASVWSVTSGLMLIFSIFTNLLIWVSSKLTFQNPSNFLFFCSTILLLGVSIQFSFELGKLEESNRKITIEIALLKNEIEKNNGR